MFLQAMKRDFGGQVTLACIVFLLVIVPVFNLLIPESNPLHVSTLTVTLLGKYLTYALLAVAVDLVWGYLGILSLGHGAFFALGGYVMAMHLTREIGNRGSYGNAELPDFMVFLNYSELPWFWEASSSFVLTLFLIALVPALLAGVFGFLAFRSRVTGVYLSIMTQALTFALLLAFGRNEMGMGGSSGLTGFKDVLGFDLQSDATRVGLFVLSGIALIVGYLLVRWLINSRLGLLTVAIRDAESRTRFIGYNVENTKLFVFVVSAIIAGVAGALYVPQVGIINPDEFEPIKSIELLIWVAVGGRATLFGAVAGALLVNYAKTELTSAYPDEWLFGLGAMFVIVTLYLPDGLVGLFKKFKSKKVNTENKTNNESEASA